MKVAGRFGLAYVCVTEEKGRGRDNLLFNFLDEQFLSRFTAKLP